MFRSPTACHRVCAVTKRLSSTQVVARDSAGGGILKTKLKNGLTVATTEAPNKHASISVLIKAGSRYEDGSSNLGISHCLRAGSCLTTNKGTAWHATQLLGALGGNFEVVGTREHLSYNLQCGRRVWRDLLSEVVAPSICESRFFWWELKDLSLSMKHQLSHALADPAFRLMDALHKASFRGGLSNSILSPESMIGSHSSEMAQEFFNSNFSLNNTVLVGTGVNHEELCDVGDAAFATDATGTPSHSPSEFVSSEVRLHEMTGSLHIGLSFAGSALNDQDAIATAVLQNILGSDSYIKRQSWQASRLGAAAAKKVNEPFTLTTFNINYSDSGLLGVYVKSSAKAAGQVLAAVAEETSSIAGGGISEKDVEAGKQGLKASVLMQTENAQGLIDDIGVQMSLLGGCATPDEIASKIDAVTTSQVTRVAKKVLSGKKSLAVVGDTTHCPYLSDL